MGLLIEKSARRPIQRAHERDQNHRPTVLQAHLTSLGPGPVRGRLRAVGAEDDSDDERALLFVARFRSSKLEDMAERWKARPCKRPAIAPFSPIVDQVYAVQVDFDFFFANIFYH